MIPIFYTGQDVRIDGSLFNTTDANGCRWVLSDLEGWWGLPDPELPDDQRPFWQDGNYFSTGRFQSRNIVLKGVIVPPPGEDFNNGLVKARRSLNESVDSVRRLVTLSVDESTPKQAHVQMVGRPLTAVETLNRVLQFNIQLRAADPRKYSTVESIAQVTAPLSTSGRTYPKTFSYTYSESDQSNTVIVINEGTYETDGILKITGPVMNPSVELIEQGAELKFNISLQENDVLEVDLRTHSVLLNGVASRRGTLKAGSTWFNIPPGQSTLRYQGVTPANSTSTSMVYLTYRSAWME